MAAAYEMNWFCYLLRCIDGSLYCGITSNLDKRIAAHNEGIGAKFTRGRRPVELVYHEICVNKSAALKREIEIKKLRRTDKLALISHGITSTTPYEKR